MGLLFRFLLRIVLRILYGYRAYGSEHLKTSGPVILVPNHVSWLDWLFVLAILEDDWMFVTSSITARTSWIHKKVMCNSRTIPIDPGSPYAVKHLAEILSKKGRLVIFAEGRLSETGELMKTMPGVSFLVQKTGAKVLIGYLRGVRYLKWVRHHGYTRFFPRVTFHVDVPHTTTSGFRKEVIPGTEYDPAERVATVRSQITSWLRDEMLKHQVSVNLNYGPQTIPAVVKAMYPLLKWKKVWQDFSYGQISYRKLVLGANLLGEALKKHLVTSEGNRVGFVLPGVNAAPVTLLALWCLGKTPTILNFSSGIKTVCDCAKLARIKQIVTARSFVKQTHFDVEALDKVGVKMVYLEDIKVDISLWSKVSQVICCRCRVPKDITAETTAAILFTSGSEGSPKGVELSHRNLIANVEQAVPFANVADDEHIFNALPIFHGFGLLLGIMVPMVRGIFCFNYPSPLHYRVIPSLIYDRSSTVFCATNTFLNGYMHYAQPADFGSLKLLIVGGEKLQLSTMKACAEKFSTLVVEGYGVTECSPVIGVNTKFDNKPGSIGRPLPGIQTRLEPVPGIKEGGRLLVKGPNIMSGYLNADANEAFQALGGWYDTGDIATIDAQGFITLLGRVKRFAKVSGEMISLTAVEDVIKETVKEFGEEFQVAVSAVSCEERGETLVLVTNEAKLTDARVREVVRASGLSNLCIPRSVVVVDSLPRLGSGKVDYIGLRAMLEKKEK